MVIKIGNSKINCGKCGHENVIVSNANENTTCEKCNNVLIRRK